VIKYECDSCSKIVVAAEAFGPGVWREAPTTDMNVQWEMGKPYPYYSPDTGIQINIMPVTQWGEHFCGECTLRTVRDCVATMWPEDPEPNDEPSPSSEEDSPSSDTSSDVRDVRAGGELPDASTDEPADTVPPNTYIHKPDPKNPVTVQWTDEHPNCLCERITSGPLTGALKYDERCPVNEHGSLALMDPTTFNE